MVWQPSHSNINLVPCAHRTTVVDNCGQTSGPSEGNLVSPGAHQAAPPAPGATEQRCPAGAGNLSSAHMEFLTHVSFDEGTGCWYRSFNPCGSGRYSSYKDRGMAHRVAYELFIGPIAPGLVVDHLCCNKACCNPLHLEVVSNRENIRRARKRSRTGVYQLSPLIARLPLVEQATIAIRERDERIRGYFADPELFRQAAACERTQANPQNQIRREAVQS